MTPPPHFQNSCGQLLAILKTVPAGGCSYTQWVIKYVCTSEVPSKQVKAVTYKKLNELQDLYQVVWNDIKQNNVFGESQKMLFSTGISSIFELLTPNDLTSHIRPLTEAESSIMNLCASFMPQHGEIEDDYLQAIWLKIDSLQELVDDGDLCPVLKKSLQELLRLSMDAIMRYRTYGGEGLKNQFRSMLGEVHMLWGEIGGEAGIQTDDEKLAIKGIGILLQSFETALVRVGTWQPGIQLIRDGGPILTALLAASQAP